MWAHPYVVCTCLVLLVRGLFLVWMPPAVSFLSVCWPLSPGEAV